MRALIFLFILFLSSCQPSAQAIIDEAIEAHGGKKYENLDVSFDFRDKHYRIQKQGASYRYERQQTDSTGTIVDVLNNEGFSRTRNGKAEVVPDSMATKYTESINSVAYFFLLPAPLNDPAVHKKLLPETTIKNNRYAVVEVTFSEDGGGKDHDDSFMYWINKTTKNVDYFAYAYATNGGGVRFREAFHCQTQNGLRYCDYRNYGFESLDHPLTSLPIRFEKGEMPLASTIENKNVVVK